jgi:hypothetical protein
MYKAKPYKYRACQPKLLYAKAYYLRSLIYRPEIFPSTLYCACLVYLSSTVNHIIVRGRAFDVFIASSNRLY